MQKRRRRLLMMAIPVIVAAVAAGFFVGPRSEKGVGASALSALGGAGKARGYNLLVVTIDTLRADHVGCYGYETDTTPTIDRLAATGVRFTRAMTTAPITLPSHSSLFTALYVPNHGARHNGSYTLSDDHVTLAESLGKAGYETGAFVAAYVLDGRYGLNQGFDHYDDNVNPTGIHQPDSHFNERNARFVSDAAIEWLGARDPNRPFFTWLHYFDPHLPYRPPPSHRSRFAHPYDSEIAFADEQLGRVLAFLETQGLRDRTLVVFAADHGEGLWDHGEQTHTIFIYDTTVRIPLILSCPTLFTDSVSYGDGVVSLVDVLPTVLGLLGVPQIPGVDGIDLFAHPPDPERVVYVETLAPLLDFGWASLHGLCRAGEKFIQAPQPELYDTRNDPGELRNLYREGKPPELQARLHEMLLGWESTEDALSRELPLDPEQRARLEALGYIRAPTGPGKMGVNDPKRMVPLWNQITEAEGLSASGQHPAAVERIRAVIKEDPGNAKAWYTATRIFRLAGNSRLAEIAIQTAVQLHPRSDGFVTLAQYALLKKDQTAFEEAIAKAIELDPADGGIYIARGDRFAMVGRFREAIVEFQKAESVDPWRSGPQARRKIEQARKRL